MLFGDIARRLQKVLRAEDSICRLGGDEFVVLLQEVTKFEAVVTVAEKLLKNISKPIRLGNNQVHIGMSFGIALYPTDGDDAKTLLRKAIHNNEFELHYQLIFNLQTNQIVSAEALLRWHHPTRGLKNTMRWSMPLSA